VGFQKVSFDFENETLGWETSGHAQTGLDATRATSNETPFAAKPQTVAEPYRSTPAQHFVCNTSYHQQQCNEQSSPLSIAKAAARLRGCGIASSSARRETPGSVGSTLIRQTCRGSPMIWFVIRNEIVSELRTSTAWKMIRSFLTLAVISTSLELTLDLIPI
jgi:hypothetical protein